MLGWTMITVLDPLKDHVHSAASFIACGTRRAQQSRTSRNSIRITAVAEYSVVAQIGFTTAKSAKGAKLNKEGIHR